MPPGSFALLIKLHGAVTDPGRRKQLLDALHDDRALLPPPAPSSPWFAQRPRGARAHTVRGASETLLSPRRLLTPLVRAVPTALAFAGDLLKWPDHDNLTRFNSMVSPHRVFDSRCFALDDFASMAALVPGATLNDAIVAVCAGGLRSYLELNAQLPTADLSAQL